MENSEVALLNLLFDDFTKLGEKKSFNEYIRKLGTYRCEELLKEPKRLHDEKLSIFEQTQDLAVKNYKSFIQTAECSKQSSAQFNAVEGKLNSLLEHVPKFEQKCEEFLIESNKFSNLRKLNSLTLTRSVKLVEILELSQLMDNFIKDDSYDQALELAAYVHRLHTKHPDIEIFQTISAEVDKLWQILLHQLLKQLHKDIQLPKCLEIVGHLRRMGSFSEPELRLKFLQARNSWLEDSLKQIPTNDLNQHLSRTIEVTRVNLFNIVTQYRAVFNDDDHNPLLVNNGKYQNVNQNCIFFAWLNQKISVFLTTLKNDLASCTASLDSFLGQCMYFGLSFGKVGCDFRLMLVPIFLEAIVSNFQRNIQNATIEYEANMEKFTLINKNFSKLSWKSRNEDPLQPPDSLLEFYPLAEYANKVLISFNSLRLCAPIASVNDVTDIMQESLVKVADGLLVLYGQEHQAFTANAKDAFTRLCMAFADDFLPYIQKCFHIIYQPTNIAQYLGIGVQTLQDKGITIFNRDQIIANIRPLLPQKIVPE
ncbi:PREDICTED: conserved oligomeric Golgi complex subunit 8 [Nicrophorus vespilloides]|uniref:Conserved oligomeric Golgi complex subunit 8 n=1 Tax=Nicrophorus vespilloides TaxID=110193 RepID=A0ABM1N8Q8_NICVS|nr:PREDICTED: conserved oligomeric Golgi complex subunit 8 [Nicrophorus vespilloides]